MCWTWSGHSLKKLGHSQRTLRPSWCPKLVTGLVYACEKHTWTALNASTCNGMFLRKSHEKLKFRVRACGCILSCVLVTINTHTLKCWYFSSYSGITHLYCFKNVVPGTKSPNLFFENRRMLPWYVPTRPMWCRNPTKIFSTFTSLCIVLLSWWSEAACKRTADSGQI